MSDDLAVWLRRQIEARRALARDTTSLGNAEVWTEPTSGVLVTGDGSEAGHWDGTWAMGDSTLTRLMAANDPHDTIARCEAELAILDLYEEQAAKAGMNSMEEDRTWMLWRVISLLGAGYRHRPDYREEWKP